MLAVESMHTMEEDDRCTVTGGRMHPKSSVWPMCFGLAIKFGYMWISLSLSFDPQESRTFGLDQTYHLTVVMLAQPRRRQEPLYGEEA